VVFCHIQCTLHYIIQGVDPLQIKKGTRCLFGTGKLTTTYQSYKNFYYTYIIILFFTLQCVLCCLVDVYSWFTSCNKEQLSCRYNPTNTVYGTIVYLVKMVVTLITRLFATPIRTPTKDIHNGKRTFFPNHGTIQTCEYTPSPHKML